MVHPENIDKILEIYEYYDGPLSSLVLLKNGTKILLEVIDWSHQTKELWELAVVLTEDEINLLKKDQPSLKLFLMEKVIENKVYLWYYQNLEVYVKIISKQELEKLIIDMSLDYKFEDNSQEWKNYC